MNKYLITKRYIDVFIAIFLCSSHKLLALPLLEKNKPMVDDVSSLFPYLAKVLLVLAVLLAALLMLSLFFKRVFQGKKKIGFLDASSLLEVMTTKAISPKRHLMIVRAHQQVFLMANSEQGIHCLSELQGLSDLLKVAEKEILGESFDEIQEKIIHEGLEENKLKEDTKISSASKTKKMIQKKLSEIKSW